MTERHDTTVEVTGRGQHRRYRATCSQGDLPSPDFRFLVSAQALAYKHRTEHPRPVPPANPEPNPIHHPVYGTRGD